MKNKNREYFKAPKRRTTVDYPENDEQEAVTFPGFVESH